MGPPWLNKVESESESETETNLMNINEVDAQKWISHCAKGAKFMGLGKLGSNSDNLTFMVHGPIFQDGALCFAWRLVTQEI